MRLDAPASWVFLLLNRDQPRDGVLLVECAARVGVADVLRLRHLSFACAPTLRQVRVVSPGAMLLQ